MEKGEKVEDGWEKKRGEWEGRQGGWRTGVEDSERKLYLGWLMGG